MIKKLPVLYKTEKNIFREVEIKKPSGGVLSGTKDAVNNSDKYTAMVYFVSGCTEKIIGDNMEITDPVSIKSAYAKMSPKNIEYLSQEAMIFYYDGEDYIEGLYKCPMCGKVDKAEKKNIEGIEIDTRDRISDLKIGFMKDEIELVFDVVFTKPVKIESEVITEEIEKITMGFYTTENLIRAYNSFGDLNETKLQYRVWADSIISANGQEVDDSWRRSFGMQLFNNVEEVEKDLNQQISKYINKYGVSPYLEKVCKNSECGKIWNPIVNTSNFFVSALQ